MIESLANGRVLLVPVHNVHLHGVADVVNDMLGSPVVLVAPVEVEALHLELTGQLGAPDVG